MAVIDKFNEGGTTSSTVERQINDEFWSKGAIREAQKKRVFTQLGDKLTQPKNYGDKIVKERHLPILHELNRLDGGIEAETATLVTDTFYAYSLAGTLLGTFASVDYAKDQAAAEQAAADLLKGSAATAAEVAAYKASGQIKSGSGLLYGGNADFATVNSTFPTLSEEGGDVNRVNTKTILVEAPVAEFGVHARFTQKSIDMDSSNTVLSRKTAALGELKGDTFEAQIQSSLLAASEANRTMGGTVATTKGEANRTSVLTYADLRHMEKELKRLLVPKDTKIITGSTKIDTKVIPNAYYVYVGAELVPTLEDLQHNGVYVWKPVESYKDAANATADGEIGAIGRFRFIEVPTMQKYMGEGVADGVDASDDDTDGYYATNGKFDVFPMLFVGSDSFATVGFEGDSSRIKTAMPKAGQYNDPFGKLGTMSIAWYFGALIYRPERIRQLSVTAAEI